MTRYGYMDLEWITDIFVPLGFVSVGQDMRGTALSQGNFTMWQSDKNDSQDLGDWIVQQPWSNGKVQYIKTAVLISLCVEKNLTD